MRKGERVRKTVRLNSVEMTGHVTEELKDLLFTWGSIEYVSLLIETRDILQGKRRRCNAISCFFLLGLVKGLLLLLFIYSLPRLSSQNIYVKWQGSFPCRLVAFSFPSDRHKNRSNSCNVLCICRVLLATWVEKEELEQQGSSAAPVYSLVNPQLLCVFIQTFLTVDQTMLVGVPKFLGRPVLIGKLLIMFKLLAAC